MLITRAIDNNFSFFEIMIAIILLFFAIFWLGQKIGSFLSFKTPDKETIEQSELMTILSVSGTGLFILIVFVTLNVWNFLQSTSQVCIQDASALANIIKNATFMTKSPSSERVLHVAQKYVVDIRTIEWKAMADGDQNENTDKEWNNLFQAIRALGASIPGTGTDSIYFQELLSNFNHAELTRNQRLNGVHSVVPTQLRRAIVFGGLSISFLIGILCRKKQLHQMTSSIVFVLLLGFNLALALVFDFPYSGFSVNKDVYYRGILGDIPDSIT